MSSYLHTVSNCSSRLICAGCAAHAVVCRLATTCSGAIRARTCVKAALPQDRDLARAAGATAAQAVQTARDDADEAMRQTAEAQRQCEGAAQSARAARAEAARIKEALAVAESSHQVVSRCYKLRALHLSWEWLLMTVLLCSPMLPTRNLQRLLQSALWMSIDPSGSISSSTHVGCGVVASSSWCDAGLPLRT